MCTTLKQLLYDDRLDEMNLKQISKINQAIAASAILETQSS